MTRLVAVLIGAVLAGAGLWYYVHPPQQKRAAEEPVPSVTVLDRLYSQNPREVEAAKDQVTELGPKALPVIQAALRDPNAEADRLKGALKACGILGPAAAPAIPDVAEALAEPGLTAEAAVALSYMGQDAFPALRTALGSQDPMVRRESLRSIGKLEERAQLDRTLIVPLLIGGIRDRDAGVRAVAATYLGIIRAGATEAVPALTSALEDPDPEVRRASAEALGSFGEAAAPALPALRKAASDENEDVAREAERAIVKLQPDIPPEPQRPARSKKRARKVAQLPR